MLIAHPCRKFNVDTLLVVVLDPINLRAARGIARLIKVHTKKVSTAAFVVL